MLPPTLQGPLSKFMAGEICGSSSVDWQALGQAHTAVVAGACLALGVRHAGSASAEAEGVLRHYLLYLLEAKRQAPERQACELPASICGMFSVLEFVFDSWRLIARPQRNRLVRVLADMGGLLWVSLVGGGVVRCPLMSHVEAGPQRRQACEGRQACCPTV